MVAIPHSYHMPVRAARDGADGAAGAGGNGRRGAGTTGWRSGRRLVVVSGPRGLFDATSVPADRGGVGRYVDGLLAALSRADANLAVVCQRTDTERYRRALPSADVLSAP